MGLGLSLWVFRKSYLLRFSDEMPVGMFLKEGVVRTQVHQHLEGILD